MRDMHMRPRRFATPLAAAALLFLAACGSPAAGFGYHPGDDRIATLDHPVVIANPIADSQVDSPLVLFGDATAFKGIVDYEVVSDATGEVVDSGTTMAGSMGTFSKFAVELELEPGNYTVTVSQTDPPERALKTGPFSASLSFAVTG